MTHDLQSSSESEPGTGRSARILIVDDEPFILELLSEMLKLLGHAPMGCSSPEKALTLLDEHSFDVVLSDFRMPRMNGEQFYRAAVARHPRMADRMVFLTGDSQGEDAHDFLKQSRLPHLPKPFQLESVEQVIAGIIQQG